MNGADLLKLATPPAPAGRGPPERPAGLGWDGSLENQREVLLAAAVDMKRAAP